MNRLALEDELVTWFCCLVLGFIYGAVPYVPLMLISLAIDGTMRPALWFLFAGLTAIGIRIATMNFTQTDEEEG